MRDTEGSEMIVSGVARDGGRRGEGDPPVPCSNSPSNDDPSCASASAFSGTFRTTGTAPANDSIEATTVGDIDSIRGGLKHAHVSQVNDEAIEQFHEAMSLVDESEREGWTRALDLCPPAVLRHECCPCYFIRACQFNPWDAAARMCLYWKERIHLFEDRAFEAMTLGSEAVPPTGLTTDDVKTLETGSMVVLPKDRKGRTVLFVDEGKLKPGMVDQAVSRLRVLWYVLQAGYTSGGDNAHRIVNLYACYRPPNSGQYSRGNWQFSAGSARIGPALPIVVDSIHLLMLPTKTGTGRLIQFILKTTAAMQTRNLLGLTKVHIGTAERGGLDGPLDEEALAKSDLLQKLADEGFTTKGLPDWVGGAFDERDFFMWTKRRRRWEQRAFWTPEQFLEHRRSLNKVHSRKKRRRRNDEVSDLQEQVTLLQTATARARVVHEYLENLVTAAIQTVSHLPEPSIRPPTQGLVDRNFWNSCDPNVLSDYSEEERFRSALASLEPDPIVPTFTGSHGTRFTGGPAGPLAAHRVDPDVALPEPTFAGADRSAAGVEAALSLASRVSAPTYCQPESYAATSSAWQLLGNSNSGDSFPHSFPTVATPGPPWSKGSTVGHLSEDSVVCFSQPAMGSIVRGTELAYGTPAACPRRQAVSELLDPTNSSDTALLFRSTLQRRQQLLAEMNPTSPSPAGHKRLPFSPEHMPYEDQGSSHRLPSAQSASSWQSSALDGGVLNLLDLSAPGHSGSWRVGGATNDDDGRVDATSLFDEDWT